MSNKDTILLIIALCLFSILMHASSFNRNKLYGDQGIYRYLGEVMNWDGSNYTTKSAPVLKDWPYDIYTKPLFHHGPLLPYIIKIGAIFGLSVSAAMLFANILMILFIVHLYILFKRLKLDNLYIIAAVLFVVCDPILFFSTTRVGNDGTAGLLNACALIALIESSYRRSSLWLLWSALLVSLSLNLKFTSLVVLPPFLLLQLFLLKKCSIEKETEKKVVIKFLIMPWLLILSIGMQHFYRLFLEYGTILPWQIINITKPEDPFILWINQQTHSLVLMKLVLLLPYLLLLFLPGIWKVIFAEFRQFSLKFVFALLAAYFFVTVFCFTHYEIRFYAFVTPFFYCFFPWVLAGYSKNKNGLLLGWLFIALLMMFATCYREVTVRFMAVFQIQPLLVDLLPFLKLF